MKVEKTTLITKKIKLVKVSNHDLFTKMNILLQRYIYLKGESHMEENFDVFFKTHQGRISFQLNRLGITGERYDTFYAEGIVALWHGYKQYDKQKGNIGTYLNYQIRYRLIDLIRDQNKEKADIEQVCREEIIKQDAGNHHSKSDAPIPDVSGITLENTLFWEEVKCHLNPEQWKWVEYFVIANLSAKEIMEIEDVDIKTVKSWAKGARRRLRKNEIKAQLKTLI